jgi:hypothetical protein
MRAGLAGHPIQPDRHAQGSGAARRPGSRGSGCAAPSW